MENLEALQTRQSYLQAHPEDEKFPGELEAFNDVMDWLTNFANKVAKQSPTGVVNSLVQLGIEDPHRKDYFGDFDCGEPLGSWFKMYQWQYNTAIWEVITNQNGLLQKLRQVLRKDMKFEGSELGPEWGKHVIKAYSQALLDYFLQPKGPAWCINPSWQTPELLEALKPTPKLSA